MHTMHSTLLIGSYDWERERLPKQEFEERLAALWKQLPAEVGGIAAFGDRRSNAELAYLTNFIPKLRDGMVVITREGQAKLFVAGAGNMMPIAARQTWVENLTPLSEPGKVLGEWKTEVKGSIAMAGGENLRAALRKGVDEVAAGAPSKQLDAALRAMMRPKRARELDAIRANCAILKAMAQALTEAHRAGKGPTASVIAAEHVAYKMGGQEARSLLSLDGGRTLRPFTAPVEKGGETLQAYLAIRKAGYWVEGFVSAARSEGPARAKAREALKALVAAAKPGARAADLVKPLQDGLKPFGEHPVTAGRAGNGIGLSLEEAPNLSTGSGDVLAAGDVVSLRAGASGEGGHAIVSAMVAVTAGGNEVLWMS